MREFGEFTGWLINLFFAATLMNYVLKFISKRYMKSISKNPTLKKCFTTLMKIIVKNHKWFGTGTIVFLLVHFYIQATTSGLILTGLLAGSLMIFQFLLGAYGTYISKKRQGLWLIIHRAIAVMLVASILIHII